MQQFLSSSRVQLLVYAKQLFGQSPETKLLRVVKPTQCVTAKEERSFLHLLLEDVLESLKYIKTLMKPSKKNSKKIVILKIKKEIKNSEKANLSKHTLAYVSKRSPFSKPFLNFVPQKIV